MYHEWLRKLCVTASPVCLKQAKSEKILSMKQASLKLNRNVKKTRKQVLLEQMDQVVPQAALVELIAPYYPEGKTHAVIHNSGKIPPKKKLKETNGLGRY